jgi:hypothetical protein
LSEHSEEKQDIDKAWDKHEGLFKTTNKPVRMIADQLLKVGYDFFDQFGQPLRTTEYFSRQVEFVEMGLGGRRPNKFDATAKAWETALKRDAQRFKSKLSR